jgi:hypothetical protein
VDEIRTEIKILEPITASTSSLPSGQLTLDDAPTATQRPKQNIPLPGKTSIKPSVAAPVRQAAEQPVTYADKHPRGAEGGWDDMPPPPDNFPEDWETKWQPSFEEASIAARPEPKVNSSPVSEPPAQTETVEVESKPNEREQARPVLETRIVQPVESTPIQSTDFLPSLYIPLAQEEKDKEHPPQQITVILRSTGDKEHDRRRIKTLYGTLISFHGRDRFSFHIFEDGKGYLIDFPNDTTRVCIEALDRLKKLIGEESWRVEEITFQ